MNKIKKVARTSKNFVVKHKLAIGVITTAIICAKINANVNAEKDGIVNEFLDIHDLTDQFADFNGTGIV